MAYINYIPKSKEFILMLNTVLLTILMLVIGACLAYTTILTLREFTKDTQETA